MIGYAMTFFAVLMLVVPNFVHAQDSYCTRAGDKLQCTLDLEVPGATIDGTSGPGACGQDSHRPNVQSCAFAYDERPDAFRGAIAHIFQPCNWKGGAAFASLKFGEVTAKIPITNGRIRGTVTLEGKDACIKGGRVPVVPVMPTAWLWHDSRYQIEVSGKPQTHLPLR